MYIFLIQGNFKFSFINNCFFKTLVLHLQHQLNIFMLELGKFSLNIII